MNTKQKQALSHARLSLRMMLEAFGEAEKVELEDLHSPDTIFMKYQIQLEAKASQHYFKGNLRDAVVSFCRSRLAKYPTGVEGKTLLFDFEGYIKTWVKNDKQKQSKDKYGNAVDKGDGFKLDQDGNVVAR